MYPVIIFLSRLLLLLGSSTSYIIHFILKVGALLLIFHEDFYLCLTYGFECCFFVFNPCRRLSYQLWFYDIVNNFCFCSNWNILWYILFWLIWGSFLLTRDSMAQGVGNGIWKCLPLSCYSMTRMRKLTKCFCMGRLFPFFLHLIALIWSSRSDFNSC